MTIDIHSHLFVREFYRESLWDRYVRLNASWRPSTMTEEEAEVDVRSKVLPAWWDTNGTGHIRRMDEAGIEKTVILYIDQALQYGETDITVEEQNSQVSEVARKYPDRIIYFCGVDPRREGAVKLFEKCVNEWGAQGLKLYPTTGFFPADKAAYPLYERASAWKIPVLYHTGPEGLPYTHPSVLLRVLIDFPNLMVIAAHLSNELWRDLIALGKARENVMCDISAKQIVAKQNYGQFCYILRKFLDEFGVERVMFGTDAPLLERAASSKEWVQIIKELPEKAPKEYRFTEEEVSALLDGNAQRLLDSIAKR